MDMLHQMLWSLIRQEYENWDLVVVDDNDEPQPWDKYGVYPRLFNEMKRTGHDIRIAKGPGGRGIGAAYQVGVAASLPESELFFRVDDDSWMEPDYLRKLAFLMQDPKVGACGGLFLHPGQDIETFSNNDERYKHATIADLSDQVNIQWFRHVRRKPISVEHLTANILFSKTWLERIGGFETELFAQHRDETQASWRVHVEGGQLLVDPTAVAWHLKGMAGGARGHAPEVYVNDHRNFVQQRKSMKPGTFIHIGHAIGDAMMATPAVDAFKEKAPEREITIWHPSAKAVFNENPNVEEVADYPLGSQRTARYYGSVYGWAAQNNYSGHLAVAHCRMWGLPDAEDTTPRLYLNGDDHIKEEDKLTGHYAVLTPYSTAKTFDFGGPSDNKNWFEDRWRAVIRHLQNKGLTVVQMRGSENEPLMEGVDKDVCGEPLLAVFQWIRDASILISIDTMGHHVGCAFETPSVVLWGRSKPENFGYFRSFIRNIEGQCPGVEVDQMVLNEEGQPEKKRVRLDRPCIGGNQFNMDQDICRIEKECMKQVTVEDVCGAIDELLEEDHGQKTMAV
jgi:ADP-heptose:LPS heptosyltransferase/GT2 family glycosyltransferase